MLLVSLNLPSFGTVFDNAHVRFCTESLNLCNDISGNETTDILGISQRATNAAQDFFGSPHHDIYENK